MRVYTVILCEDNLPCKPTLRVYVLDILRKLLHTVQLMHISVSHVYVSRPWEFFWGAQILTINYIILIRKTKYIFIPKVTIKLNNVNTPHYELVLEVLFNKITIIREWEIPHSLPKEEIYHRLSFKYHMFVRAKDWVNNKTFTLWIKLD